MQLTQTSLAQTEMPHGASAIDEVQMRHLHIYQMLKRYGFSPAKVREILLDAQRGDAYARSVIKIARISRQ